MISVISLGIITSLFKGYGDDLDSHGLILSFISIYEKGVYSPSRFQGAPVAEILYGYLGYNYGSFPGSFLSYIFFIASIILILKIFLKEKYFKEYVLLFIFTCISNPVLFLNNTNPSDFPLSLFLFSVGFYFFRNNYKLLAITFFTLLIGTRIEFTLYLLFIFIYEFYYNKKKSKEIINIFIFSFVLGSLFYIPILLKNDFSLSFITSNSSSMNFIPRIVRFVYKSYLSFGVFSSLLILVFFLRNIKNIKNIFLKNKDLMGLILLISFVFIYMPTKTSIFSLAIILSYVILFKTIDKKMYIYILIFLNLLYYLISYQVLEIRYKNSGNCDPIIAVDGKFVFNIDKGYLAKRNKFMKNQIECASYQFGSKSQKYIEGKKMK